MVSFLVNALIILLIVDFAAYQLVKTLKKAKRGKCAAYDYDCVLKKQVDAQRSGKL